MAKVFEPRAYQQKTINDARVALREIKARLALANIKRGPRLLIQCPTGGGKTVIATLIIMSHIANGGFPNFMVHRDFLLEQTMGTFTDFGIDHTPVHGKRWFNEWARTHVCMIPSMKSRIEKVRVPTLCIWDETQHIAAGTWAKIMERWPDAIHIGLSATPIRLDGKGFEDFFDDIVLGPSVAELIKLKALSDYRYFAPSAPDLTAFHTRMGDYKQDEIDEEMGRSVIIGDLVKHYTDFAGSKAIYFCTSVKNSQDTADAFNQKGFRFRHLDGTSTSHERRVCAQMLARGELDGLTNVDLFGEGFDLSAQAKMDVTVELVGLARPTKSLAMSRQQVGRVLRAKEYPGIILDHAGHLMNHGLPDDDVEWSLKGAEKSEPDYKTCDNCGASTRSNAIVCTNCGTKFEKKARAGAGGGVKEVEHIEGDLHEVDRNAVRKQKKMEEWNCKGLQDFIDLGKSRSYQYPEEWAAKMWTIQERKIREKEYAAKQQLSFYESMGR